MADDLDRAIRRELESLPIGAAEDVARHLVASGRFADEDPVRALAHARAAKRRAGRVAAVREAVAIAAYLAGEWAEALTEFRAVRRMTGSVEVMPLMADCERGLGRPERALEILDELDGVRGVPQEVQIEALLVRAGARSDLGQPEAALALLRRPAESSRGQSSPVARVRYAYAQTLLAVGEVEKARVWFQRALDADTHGVTDAAERVDELDGIDVCDLDSDQDSDADSGHPPTVSD